MFTRGILIGVVIAVIGFCAPAAAQDSANEARLNRVVGEKLDSGLGQLPPYREWQGPWNAGPVRVSGRLNPVAGEKLDSGLGELPAPSGPSVAPVLVTVHTACN